MIELTHEQEMEAILLALRHGAETEEALADSIIESLKIARSAVPAEPEAAATARVALDDKELRDMLHNAFHPRHPRGLSHYCGSNSDNAWLGRFRDSLEARGLVIEYARSSAATKRG